MKATTAGSVPGRSGIQDRDPAGDVVDDARTVCADLDPAVDQQRQVGVGESRQPHPPRFIVGAVEHHVGADNALGDLTLAHRSLDAIDDCAGSYTKMFPEQLDLEAADVEKGGPVDAGGVAVGQPVGVDEDEVADTEALQLLGHRRASAPATDDRHPQIAKHAGDFWPEGQNVAVVRGRKLGPADRRRTRLLRIGPPGR